jgi:hypothetical protein
LHSGVIRDGLLEFGCERGVIGFALGGLRLQVRHLVMGCRYSGFDLLDPAAQNLRIEAPLLNLLRLFGCPLFGCCQVRFGVLTPLAGYFEQLFQFGYSAALFNFAGIGLFLEGLVA